MAASARTSDGRGWRYLIGLGSNQRHHRHGRPDAVLWAALTALEAEGVTVEVTSPTIASLPLGPSLRRYANAAAILRTDLTPMDLLALLKAVERQFGRRTRGQRWSSRVLDLDILLWDAGPWSSPDITVPHISFRDRRFVLEPARTIAPRWRDPLTGLSVQTLYARLTRPRPLPIRPSRKGP
jgi:2-amino-4-hydroxy-6-hydroxymethyldihydropteridine diphosphokinase